MATSIYSSMNGPLHAAPANQSSQLPGLTATQWAMLAGAFAILLAVFPRAAAG